MSDLDCKTIFKRFYENPIIMSLADKQKWTVSDSDKRPIDMYDFKLRGSVHGAITTKGYNPYLTLNELCDLIPNAANNAFALDALEDDIVVLDIEPCCPKELRAELLKLPFEYAEISMSGKGIHMIFQLPRDILDKYPIVYEKTYMREENGYYEILLQHMVTFTRKSIARSQNPADISAFDKLFTDLAKKEKASVKVNVATINQSAIDSIPYFDAIHNCLKYQEYKKTPEDFQNKDKSKIDYSAYEFAMCGFYYRKLMKCLPDGKFKDHIYTDAELSLIIYTIIKEKLEHRAKHDEARKGMPWLLYIAATFVAKAKEEGKDE